MYAKQRNSHGFTLIELLVVVAIIGILSAVALANFNAAQTRAKVSRVQEELRVLSVAVETYRLDNDTYPNPMPASMGRYDIRPRFRALTSPLSYISAPLDDAFAPRKFHTGARLATLEDDTYIYGRADYAGERGTLPMENGENFMMLASAGPDGRLNQIHYYPPTTDEAIGGGICPWCDPRWRSFLQVTIYDPSNGIVSAGDIYRWSGGITHIN